MEIKMTKPVTNSANCDYNFYKESKHEQVFELFQYFLNKLSQNDSYLPLSNKLSQYYC